MGELKKVLLVTTVSGFVPQFEMNNVKILQDMGYEVHYAANYNTPVYTDNNDRLDGTGIIRHQVDFVRSPFRIFKNIKAYRQLKKVMKCGKYDLVHCHTPMGGVIGRIAAKRAKIPYVIYTAHGFHFYKGAPLKNWICFYQIEKVLAKITDCLITINQEDYQRASQFYLSETGKVHLIQGVGIDSKKLLPARNIHLKKSLGLNENQFVFMSVGELSKRKNHQIVIRAMAEVVNQHPEVVYLISGSGTLDQSLRALIVNLKLEEHVKLLGYRTDVSDLLGITDCFIFPSKQEGLSVAVLEAMNAACPVICSKIRGNVDLIQEKKGGWLVGVDNQLEYIYSMLDLLNREDQGKSMGEFNKEYVKAYDQKHVVKEMKKIYHDLLG